MNAFQVTKHFLPEIKKYWIWLIPMFFGIIAGAISDALIHKYLGDFVTLFSKDPENALSEAQPLLFSLIITYIVLLSAWRVNEFSIVQFETRGMRDLSVRCFQNLQKHSHQFFSNNFTGSLVKKVGRMVSAFESIADTLYFRIFDAFLRLFIGVFIFVSIKPLAGLALVVWSTIFLFASFTFAIWKHKYDAISAEADSKISAALADSLSNYSTVKVFAQEDLEETRYKKVADDWRKKTQFAWNLNNFFNIVQAVLMVGIEFFIFYMAIQWWKAGTLEVGEFVFMQTYLFTIFNHLWDIGRSIRDLFKHVANAKEMAEILEMPFGVQDEHKNILQVSEGKIDCKNVSFSYSKDKTAFENFSLNIQSKEKVALVGHSGAGKSTIVKILLRLYDIQSGEILIDGQNIQEVTQNSLRKNISLVSQEPDLFHRTIAENIAYGNPNATEEQIIEAAKKAQAHGFISKFPNGYNTLVGERGVKLSGGEKQRIAIARAILEDAKILILDEATSSLDSVTEREIQKAIENAMQGKTVIVIAHRLSTIKKVDRVLVLDSGKIIEEGNHEKLLELNGKYAELWNHQVGGFLVE